MPPAARRVLVVDDDAAFAKLVAETLTEKGFEARPASDTEDALRQLAETRYEAAVVDLVMPGSDGLAVTDIIKKLSPDTQVIILTGHGTKDLAIAGIQHGVFDFLEKGTLDHTELERAVGRAVERATLLRERRELTARLAELNMLRHALHEMSTELARQPHVDRALEQLAKSARRLVRGQGARVVLFREDGDEWVVEAAAGDAASLLAGTRLQEQEGIGVLVAERDEALLVASPREHPRFTDRCDDLATGSQKLICAPLCHRDILGAVYVSGEWEEQGESYRELLESLARQAAVTIDNARQHERAINFFTHTSDLLVSILDTRDSFLGAGHSRAVAAYADLASRRLGLGDEERRDVHFAGLLHDIGKIRLDPELLGRERLSDAARVEMESHVNLGLEMLMPITLWSGLLTAIRFHHERWDGKGYPQGLAGEDIPLGARIVAVADAFDAMTRTRDKDRRRSKSEALAELKACAGSQFDPRVVRLFITEYRKRGDQIRA